MAEFISASNGSKDISSFTNSVEISKDYLTTRKLSEKLDEKTIDCKAEEEKAICTCLTKSGKKRKFTLVKDNDSWKVDLTTPEIILELYHLHLTTYNIDQAKKYATKNDLERLKYFDELMGNTVFEPEEQIAPYEIECTEYKKRVTCKCFNEIGESTYDLFKTSKGWKAEMSGSSSFDNDTIIDYNSSEDFNLNQHDLDSLTDFSQKMLDSMLSL